MLSLSRVSFGILLFAAPAAAQLVFEPPVVSTGGGLAVSVLLGDLDGDRVPDAITSHQGFGSSPTVSLGLGDGSFGPTTTIEGLSSQPRALALGDVNADGSLDLLVRGVTLAGVPVWVLLGDGAGGFGPPVNVNGPAANPSSADFGDFDDDGHLDVVIANPQSHFTPLNLAVAYGNGDGSFDPAVTLSLPDIELFLDLVTVRGGDVNGDGRDDIAYCGFTESDVLLSNGGGSFTPAVCSGTCTELIASDFELHDLNGDGRADAVTPTGSLLATPQGSFVQAQVFTQTEAPQGLAVSDFDGDGELDVAVARQHLATPGFGSALVLRGQGDGSFAEPGVVVSLLLQPRDAAAADLDGDGRVDLVVPAQVTEPGSLSSLRNHTYGPGSPFLDLGLALAGGNGHPILLAGGTLTPGSPYSFELHNGPPGGAASLYIGFSQLSAPFKGGVMIPFPNLRIGPIALGPAGSLSLAGMWPGGASGFTFWMQGWMASAGAPVGFASTSGVRVSIP